MAVYDRDSPELIAVIRPMPGLGYFVQIPGVSTDARSDDDSDADMWFLATDAEEMWNMLSAAGYKAVQGKPIRLIESGGVA